MIKLMNVSTEDDYRKLLYLESLICHSEPERWHWHYGGIGVDRYFFGNGKNDIFNYAKIIFMDNEPIGYALVYIEDFQYVVWVLPQFKEDIADAISLIEGLFKKENTIKVFCNDEKFNHLLKSIGYNDNGENKFTGVIDLSSYVPVNISWELEEIRLLRKQDISERVKYSSLPTGEHITNKMYLNYMQSDDAKNVLDYVVVDRNKKSENMIGYYSWWIDTISKTAMLNPVACVESYRKMGISKRAIQYGLHKIKEKGIKYAYVDTGYNNVVAIRLYESVGFNKCQKAIEMRKYI